MERGRRKSTLERDGKGSKEEYNGTGWKGVEGRVQWNGMERGGRKNIMERNGEGRKKRTKGTGWKGVIKT